MDGNRHLKHHGIREIGEQLSPLIGGGQIEHDCIARLPS